MTEDINIFMSKENLLSLLDSVGRWAIHDSLSAIDDDPIRLAAAKNKWSEQRMMGWRELQEDYNIQETTGVKALIKRNVSARLKDIRNYVQDKTVDKPPEELVMEYCKLLMLARFDEILND